MQKCETPDSKLLQQINLLNLEIARLQGLLEQSGIDYRKEAGAPDAQKDSLKAETNPGRPQSPIIIKEEIITAQHAKDFYAIFKGRKDVYSRRTKTKDGGFDYYYGCENFWKYDLCPKRERKQIKCKDCKNRIYKKLTQQLIIDHLIGNSEDGTDVLGIYPLLLDETCNFLVFDFDNHETKNSKDRTELANTDNDWIDEVNAMRDICKIHEIDVLVERSRSGKGAHVWMFFTEPIPAITARKFGTALLTKGAESVNQKSFKSYDRMLPAQDHMPEGGLGNLIALALQGQVLKQGNSAFIDDNWTPYENQWQILRSVKKLSKDCLLRCRHK